MFKQLSILVLVLLLTITSTTSQVHAQYGGEADFEIETIRSGAAQGIGFIPYIFGGIIVVSLIYAISTIVRSSQDKD